jgi:hypothetical protein
MSEKKAEKTLEFHVLKKTPSTKNYQAIILVTRAAKKIAEN